MILTRKQTRSNRFVNKLNVLMPNWRRSRYDLKSYGCGVNVNIIRTKWMLSNCVKAALNMKDEERIVNSCVYTTSRDDRTLSTRWSGTNHFFISFWIFQLCNLWISQLLFTTNTYLVAWIWTCCLLVYELSKCIGTHNNNINFYVEICHSLKARHQMNAFCCLLIKKEVGPSRSQLTCNESVGMNKQTGSFCVFWPGRAFKSPPEVWSNAVLSLTFSERYSICSINESTTGSIAPSTLIRVLTCNKA